MFTPQQQEVIDFMNSGCSDYRIVAVNSVAGSGKSSTAKGVIESLQPRKSKSILTAFNKGIIEDSKKKMGHLIECKTLHALAYSFFKPKEKIEPLTYTCIKENISYDDKLSVIKTLDDFFRSSYVSLSEYMDDLGLSDNIRHLANKYLDLMQEEQIPVTFNFLLKFLHVVLHKGIREIELDLFVFDEVQDVIPVTLEIFKLIKSKKKIILGDTYQNIYAYMNTVNGFDLLPFTLELRLTKSFRCNEKIAQQVSDFGKKYLSNQFEFLGNAHKEDIEDTTAYLSKTNSGLIRRMFDLRTQGKSFTCIRPINQIFTPSLSLALAMSGKPVYAKEYKFLEQEYNKWNSTSPKIRTFIQHLMETIPENQEINTACNVLDFFRRNKVSIYDFKKDMENWNKSDKIHLSTIHSYKGLEADRVYLEQDVNVMKTKALQDMKSNIDVTQDLNLYYVACTRARHTLIELGAENGKLQPL